MPEQAEGGEGSSGSSGDKGGGEKKEEGGKHKKLLRLLTVMAYLSTVSGTAFMLSLYYLFLWTPKVQLGGKALVQDPPPPSSMALFYPEMAPHLAARVADPPDAPSSGPSGPQWAARTQPKTTARRKGEEASESQVPATPQLALPTMKETEAAFAARRREARSTLMDMTSSTTMQPPSSTTGKDAHRRTPTAPAPTPSVHRGAAKSKGGGGGTSGDQWHSTPPPHPAEIAVHA